MEDRYTDGVKNAWKFAAQEAAKNAENGTSEEENKYIPVPEIRTVCCTAYKTRTGDGCRRSQ